MMRGFGNCLAGIALSAGIFTGFLMGSPSEAIADSGGFDMGFKVGGGYVYPIDKGTIDFDIDLGWRWQFIGIQFEQTLDLGISTVEYDDNAYVYGSSTAGLKGMFGVGVIEASFYVGGGVCYGTDIATSGVLRLNLEILFWLKAVQIGPFFTYQHSFDNQHSSDDDDDSDYKPDSLFGGLVIRVPFIDVE